MGGISIPEPSGWYSLRGIGKVVQELLYFLFLESVARDWRLGKLVEDYIGRTPCIFEVSIESNQLCIRKIILID